MFQSKSTNEDIDSCFHLPLGLLAPFHSTDELFRILHCHFLQSEEGQCIGAPRQSLQNAVGVEHHGECQTVQRPGQFCPAHNSHPTIPSTSDGSF